MYLTRWLILAATIGQIHRSHHRSKFSLRGRKVRKWKRDWENISVSAGVKQILIANCK